MEMNDNTAVTQANIIVTTTTHKHLKELCRFLSEYAAKLLSSGTTTIRTEKNVVRIAESYGALADFAVLPNEIMLTLWDGKREHSYTVNCKISETSLNFDTITRLSALSWKISDNNLSLDEAWKEYENILRVPRLPFPLVTFLVGCANASFCRLFNGDWIAMAIVFVATVCGFYLKHEMIIKQGLNVQFSIIASSCLSAIISCSGYVFGWSGTPDIALATSVLWLVPGIPFINAMSDLIYGHYVCCLSRFIQAIITTISLSLGLCLALMIMQINYV